MRLRQRNSWNQTLLKNCFDWSLFLFSLCSLGFNLWLWRLRGKKCLNLRQTSSEKKGRTLSVSLRIYYSTSWAWISNLKKITRSILVTTSSFFHDILPGSQDYAWALLVLTTRAEEWRQDRMEEMSYEGHRSTTVRWGPFISMKSP